MISSNTKKRIFTSLILFTGIFLIYHSKIFLVLSLLILSVVSLLEFFNIIKRLFNNYLYKSLANILFILFISFFSIMFFYFSSFFHLKIILFSLLFGCVASDIGGYLVGKTLKGPKLTKISPNKTVSGSVGSIIFTCLTFSLIIFFFTNNLNLNLLFVGFFTSISCQIGDLFFSYLKRKVKIKDTGNFLPGHGGILDRVDGILFGIPCGFLSLILIFQ